MNFEALIKKRNSSKMKNIEKYCNLFDNINEDNILKSIDLIDMEKKILASANGTVRLSNLKIKKNWFAEDILYKTVKSFEYLQENKLSFKLMDSQVIYVNNYFNEENTYCFDSSKINSKIFEILKKALYKYNPKLSLYVNVAGTLVISHEELI